MPSGKGTVESCTILYSHSRAAFRAIRGRRAYEFCAIQTPVPAPPRLRALNFLTFTPCNDLEALQQPQAFVHESADGGPSGRKSLVLNDGESASCEKPKNLGVVHACLRMIFRQVAGPNDGARELGIVLPKEFSS